MYVGDASADKPEVKWFMEQRPVLKIPVADDSRKLEIEITYQPYICREIQHLIICPPQNSLGGKIMISFQIISGRFFFHVLGDSGLRVCPLFLSLVISQN